MKHVTLNTDGSLDWGSKQGSPGKAGYAYWISSDIGRFKKYGRLPDCDNSMGPELAAIAKGIYFIRNHPELKKVTKIIVNIDCQPAIDWVKSVNSRKKSHKKHKGSLQNIARHHILLMMREGYNNLHKVTIEYRHVKAHTNDLSEARKYVNDWLDKKAKAGRFIKLNNKNYD